MNRLQKFLSDKELSFADMQQIIADYEEFEKKGMIQDCLMRFLANEFDDLLGVTGPSRNPVHWMEAIAFEVYRTIAKNSIAKGYTTDNSWVNSGGDDVGF